MSLYRGYQSAGACTSGPQPGARALMSWFLGGYAAKGGINLGIYNCRPVRGSTEPSIHGEGRAADLGINPHGAAWGWDVANTLKDRSGELGVQCLIYARKIWSGSYPDQGWRDYRGLADHFDHVHTELCWDAAYHLTTDKIRAALGGVTSVAAPPAPAASSPSGRLLVRGMRGDDVSALQRKLVTGYPAYCDFPVTGFFGDLTERCVREFQKRSHLVVDGKVGPATRGALGL